MNDRNYVPDVQYLYNFYYKEFKCQLGSLRDIKTINVSEISDKIARWSSKTGGYARVVQTESVTNNSILTICIVTPLMLRVHQTIPQSAKVVLVDYTKVLKFSAFLLSTVSPVGHLPLGFVITTGSDNTNMALDVFMSLDKNGEFFYKRGKRGPENIFAEHCFLSTFSYWPEINQYITPVDHMKTLWDTLKVDHIKINDEVLMTFTKIVYATKSSEVTAYLEEWNKQSTFDLKKTFFWRYLKKHCCSKLYSSMHHYRNLLITEEQKNIYIEYSLKTVKDIFIRHVKKFQVNQLTDFILTRFDMYYADCIEDFISGKFKMSKLKHFLPSIKHFSPDAIHQLSDNQYVINSIKDNFVDFQLGFCSCSEVALKGGVCEHQALVALERISHMSDAPVVYSPEVCNRLFFVCNKETNLEDTEHVPDETDKEESHEEIESTIEKHQIADEATNMETTNDDTETNPSKEVIMIKVEANNENSSNEDNNDNMYIQNLKDVFSEIILRVEDCPNEVMLEAMKNFCENYTSFCDNDEDLDVALRNFGKINSNEV